MQQIQPAIGQWYLRRDTSQKFEVIDLDGGDGMIEVQDADGTLDEIDVDAWSTLAIELTTQPQELAVFDNVAEPDEADGSDGADTNVTDTNVTDSLRVSDDDILGATDDDDDDDENGWDKGMEAPPFVGEERERTRHSER